VADFFDNADERNGAILHTLTLSLSPLTLSYIPRHFLPQTINIRNDNRRPLSQPDNDNLKVVKGVLFDVHDVTGRQVSIACRRRFDGTAEMIDINVSSFLPPPWKTSEFVVTKSDISDPQRYTVISNTFAVTPSKSLHQTSSPEWKGSVLVVKHQGESRDLIDVEIDEIADLTKALTEMGAPYI